jgi:ketosteroid isomerase-like protein
MTFEPGVQIGSYRVDGLMTAAASGATPKDGGEKLELKGSFMRIYQRQGNGEWPMTRDMFSSDSPPAGN